MMFSLSYIVTLFYVYMFNNRPTLNRATDVVNFAEFDDVDVDMPDYTGNYNFSTF